jgi:hypothetical protein
MAQLDPSIIAGVKMPNLGETYGNALLMGSEIASRRAQAQSEQAKIERQNKYQQALTAPIPQGMTRREALAQQGFLQEALELDKTEGEADKLKAESGIKSQEHLQKQVESAGQVLQRLVSRPDLSKATAKAELDASYQAGLIAPNLYQKAISTLETIPEEGLRAHIQSQVQALQSAKDQMTYISPDANAQLQAQTSTRNAQLGAQTTMRGQDLSYDMNTKEFGLNQEKEYFDRFDKGRKFELDEKKQQASLKNPAGTISPAQRQQDADAVLSILKQAEPLLEESTGSLVGTAYDKAAGAVGYSTEGAQKTAQLKALEGALISKMPKMSGPQSDKDVLLYKQMAGQIGDSTLPIETRKAAMETIRQLNAQYSSDPTQASAGGVPKWDDSAINAEAQKLGKSPEQIRAFLKAKGMLK